MLHTPGHTEGSVCLLDVERRHALSGDTLFAGAWGRTDLTGGSEAAMWPSLGPVARLETRLSVLPGHGATTTIDRERSVARPRRPTGAPADLTLVARAVPRLSRRAGTWPSRTALPSTFARSRALADRAAVRLAGQAERLGEGVQP